MLKLIKSPNPFLQKKLSDFDFNNPLINPRDLEEQMIQLMVEENGRGLAASQVGIDARAFVIKTEYLEGVTTPFALFNPILVGADQELIQDYEGCLSFPIYFYLLKELKMWLYNFLTEIIKSI